jgi:hypothetical protein
MHWTNVSAFQVLKHPSQAFPACQILSEHEVPPTATLPFFPVRSRREPQKLACTMIVRTYKRTGEPHPGEPRCTEPVSRMMRNSSAVSRPVVSACGSATLTIFRVICTSLAARWPPLGLNFRNKLNWRAELSRRALSRRLCGPSCSASCTGYSPPGGHLGRNLSEYFLWCTGFCFVHDSWHRGNVQAKDQ